MYSTPEELIKAELSFEVVRPIYYIIKDAVDVYKEIIRDDFYKGKYASNIKGILLSYAVQRSFDAEMLPKNFSFKSTDATMPFNKKRVELRKDNILLNLAKVNKKNSLPSKAKYKQNYAESNSSLRKQLIIDIEEQRPKINDMPYYGMITYKVAKNNLEFVDIIIPDSSYKYILKSINIVPKFELITNDKTTLDDERVIRNENLKKDIIKIFG